MQQTRRSERERLHAKRWMDFLSGPPQALWEGEHKKPNTFSHCDSTCFDRWNQNLFLSDRWQTDTVWECEIKEGTMHIIGRLWSSCFEGTHLRIVFPKTAELPKIPTAIMIIPSTEAGQWLCCVSMFQDVALIQSVVKLNCSSAEFPMRKPSVHVNVAFVGAAWWWCRWWWGKFTSGGSIINTVWTDFQWSTPVTLVWFAQAWHVIVT